MTILVFGDVDRRAQGVESLAEEVRRSFDATRLAFPPVGPDRFIVVNEHKPENLIYDPTFLGMQRSPDFMLIQVTSTVGNTKDQKLAFYRQIADELKSKLGVRPDDITINMVFVKQEDWSFGRGEPWN